MSRLAHPATTPKKSRLTAIVKRSWLRNRCNDLG